MRVDQRLTATVDWAARQGELYTLLERQAKLYTMGDSGSLPQETAQALLQSIRFTVETGLQQGADVRAPLQELLRAGQVAVWERTEEARGLLVLARRQDPGYGSLSLRDTLDELEAFFTRYDLRFFAHNIPCMIDYPLAQPVPDELEGGCYIAEYLRRLLLEHRFCRCVDRQRALAALRALSPDYRMLVLGLFEPVLIRELGDALLRGDSGGAADPGGAVHALLHPWRQERAHALLQAATGRLCARYRLWDTAMRHYLLQTVEGLLPVLRTASPQGYHNLFGAAVQTG